MYARHRETQRQWQADGVEPLTAGALLVALATRR